MTRISAFLTCIMCSTCLAQEDSSSRQMERLKALKLAPDIRVPGESATQEQTVIFPPSGVHFPYDGSGVLEIIDDGTVLLQVNGEGVFDEVTGEVIPTLENIAFRISPVGLALIENNSHLFLDRGGVQARLEALPAGNQKVEYFEIPSKVEDAENTVRTLLYLSGKISLAFDEAQSRISITAEDTESRRSFSTVAIVKAPSSFNNGVVAGTSGLNELEADFLPDYVFASSCSACCGPQGQYSCSVNCPKACQAGCRGSTPFCECIDMLN